MTLEQAIEEYGKSIIEKDYKKIVSFIYPKLFDLFPKQTIEDSLKQSYLNKEIDVQISDFKLTSIEHKEVSEGNEYLIIATSYNQVVRYADKNEEATEEAAFHYDILKEKYGEANVSFESKENRITATSFSKQLAILENATWNFLDINPNVINYYEKFLPLSIIDELRTLFPVEPEEEMTPSEEPVEKEKVNTVTEIDPDGNLQVMYLLGWEVLLNGDTQCENFIATQITNKHTFEYANVGLELIFGDKKLVRVNKYNDGICEERTLEDEEVGLPYREFKENKLLNLSESIFGLHQLGGEIPDDFQLPDNQCVVPFQYLGFINNEDKNFNWLPFKVHLACPIYLNIGHVYLDYSNPSKPTIINREEVESAGTEFADDLNQNSEIVFNESKFSSTEDAEFSGMEHAGIPLWIQNPDIPMCPKSGRRMKFLCQLNGGISAKRTNVVPKDKRYSHYYEEMNFWGDGDLFVFFEPTSKVACYFIQNT